MPLHRVQQRRTGWPQGDCVRATYAMLLDMPYDEVPRFDPAALNGKNQHAAEVAWLASLGHGLIEFKAKPGRELPEEVFDCIPEVYHLISGMSDRGYHHRCLGFGGRVVADPHPDQTGLVTIDSIAILVPLEAVAP